MTNKVLIIGNYGNYNIGDEILLKVTVLDLLEKEDVKIYIPVRNPEFINIYHSDILQSLNSFYVYDIKKLIKYFFCANKVIIGGGGLWDGNTGRLVKLIPIFLIISKILRKKIIIKSVGVYNTASIIEKILVNLSFLFADQCSVRDKESFNNIWNINKKIKIENDLALKLPNILKRHSQKYEDMLNKTSEYDILSYVRSQNKYIVGISIRQLNNISKIEIVEKISNFINIIDSKYVNTVHFVFFPFCQTRIGTSCREDDSILVNEIINKVVLKDNVTVILHKNPILWYLIMRFVDIFIGTRYHSISFAYMLNKPFLAIQYENKVWNFIQDKNLDKMVLLLEDFNENRLIQFFENNFKMLKR